MAEDSNGKCVAWGETEGGLACTLLELVCVLHQMGMHAMCCKKIDDDEMVRPSR